MYFYSSAAPATTLSAGLAMTSPGSTGSVEVASITGLPARYPFTLIAEPGTANAEVITVTQAATGTGPYTFANSVRGDDGTSAPAHSSGAAVQHGITARDLYRNSWISVLEAAYGADLTGGTTSDAAFASAVTAAQTTGNPLYIPAGNYQFVSTLDWKVPGLTVITDGSAVTTLTQQTSNIPILELAGNYQSIRGLTLQYASQQTYTQTSAIGIEFGDDTIGSCYGSIFEDLNIMLCNTGLAVNPSIATVAGLTACSLRNIRVLGFSLSGISLAGAGAPNGACDLTAIHVGNNPSGTDLACNSYPVYLGNWNDLSVSALAVEHAQVTSSDVIGLSAVGNAAISGLHLGHLELSAATGGYLALSASNAEITGMTIRSQTLTGATHNPVARFFGTGGSSCRISGYNEPDTSSGTHPWADFNSLTTCRLVVADVLATQITSQFVNFGTGCIMATVPGTWQYVGTSGQPGFATGWSNYGHGSAGLAFRMLQDGNVEIAGSVTPGSGAGVTLFTLPYSPASDQFITAVNATAGSSAGYWAAGTTGVISGGGFGGFTTGNQYPLNGKINMTV